MAVLGYCPGTAAISVGEGRMDAMVGLVGGLCGALIFGMAYPNVLPLLGPDLGLLSARSLMPTHAAFWAIVSAIAILFMGAALFLQRLQHQGWRWLHAAVALSVLNCLIALPAVAGHPIGASTAFPLAAMAITGLGAPAYWEKIVGPGTWELWFLAGSFLAGLVFALFRRDFRISGVPELWARFHGRNSFKRFAWAFIGGFLLLFGARMAGGCTSGHVISGGMQLAISSLVFAVAVFAAFLTTGRWFYRTPAPTATPVAHVTPTTGTR